MAEINLKIGDEDLMRLSSSRVLALSLKEMKALRIYAEDRRVRERRARKSVWEKTSPTVKWRP